MKKICSSIALLITLTHYCYAMELQTSTTMHDFKQYTLAAQWLSQYKEMLVQQTIKTISNEKAQKNIYYYNTDTKADITLNILTKKGLLVAFDHDEQKLREQINLWWDNGLNDQEYALSADSLLESLQQHSQDISNTLPEEIGIINQPHMYTLSQLTDIIMPLILQQINVSMSSDQYKKNLKYIFTQLLFFSFALPKTKQQLNFCECAKVSLSDRILALLVMTNTITNKYKPQQCTPNNPIVYTSFGSGSLLHDFLALSLLQQQGFNHFHVNFIDHLYGKKGFLSTLKPLFRNALTNTWHSDTPGRLTACFFPTIKDYINAYTTTPHASTIATTVDTSEINYLKEHDHHRATAIAFNFKNEYYNITEEVLLWFYDPKRMFDDGYFINRSKRYNLFNLSIHQKEKSNIMKKQIDMTIQPIQEKIYNRSLIGKITSNDIIHTLLEIQNNLKEFEKQIPPKQKNHSYTNYIIWKRSPAKDFEEIIQKTTNNNSLISILNNNKLTITTSKT